jgi:O-antigen/teichoic acid export membrane protein
MVVFSAGRLRAAVAPYHAVLLRVWSPRFSLGIVAAALGLAALAWWLRAAPVAAALVAFGATAPVVLYLWLLRRIAFSLGRPDLSLAATLIYGGATLSLMGLAIAGGGLGVNGAILLTGVAAAGASGFLARRLRWPASTGHPPADLARRHLRYGRWALGAEAVNWALTSGPILILPLWLGLRAAAELRMLGLVFMPLLQVASVASLLLLHRLAGARRADPMTVLTAFFVLAGGGAAYALAAVVGAPSLIPRVLGAEYPLDAPLLAIAGCGATCLVAAQAFIVALRARERTGSVLAANLVALLLLLALLPAALPFGVPGVAAAQGAGFAGAMLAAALLSTRRVHAALKTWQPFPGERRKTEPEPAP